MNRIARLLGRYAVHDVRCCRLMSSSTLPHIDHHQSPSSSSSTGYLLAIPALIATGLGYWQVERRSWKQDVLERRAASINADPVDIFSYPSTPPEYLRVTARGVYDDAHTQYIGPRPRSVVGGSQVGYVVITPLIDTATGRAVLVNRGWVPTAWRDTHAAAAQPAQPSSVWGISRAPPQQQAVIEGVVMRSEARNSFVPDNLPQRGEWFWIDVPALAAAAGLPHDTPLVEAVTTEGGNAVQRGTVPTAMDILGGRTRLPSTVQETYPLAKHVETFLHFHVTPQDHLHYALTWFALAGCTGYMAYKAVRGGRTRG